MILHLRMGVLSDVGRVRERNEDAQAVYIRHRGDDPAGRGDALFLVADGMGGHEAGDLASRFVADSLRQWFTDPDAGDDNDPLLAELVDALHGINRELVKFAREQGLRDGTGSTATVACVRGATLFVAHIGDSRLYRLRSGLFEQLTPDHTWVAEQHRAGVLSLEEMQDHPQGHMLTQCLGLGPEVDLHADELTIEPGDRYLLCSDGLHGPVSDPELCDMLESVGDPQQAARGMVRCANAQSGGDNVTAIVVHASEVPDSLTTTQPIPASTAPRSSRTLLLLGFLMLAAAAALGERMLRSHEPNSDPVPPSLQSVPGEESSNIPAGRDDGEIEP